MEPTPQPIDALYREEVLEARAQPPEEKLLAGAQLFDMACRITLDGIRAQHPDADEQECERILEARLALGRRLEAQS